MIDISFFDQILFECSFLLELKTDLLVYLTPRKRSFISFGVNTFTYPSWFEFFGLS